VAVQRDYYGRDKKVREILDSLNSMVESEGAPVLKKLVEDALTITHGDLVVLSYLFANFAVRTPAIIEETRAWELEMTIQANAVARKMTERLEQASLAGSELSQFLVPGPDDKSASMTLEQMNEHAARLLAEGGHRVAALDTFYSLVNIAQCIQQMTFRVVEAPPHLFFVTSDTPLTLQRRKTGSRVGAGWENNDAMGLFPLCPSHFLLIFYAEPSRIGIQQATREEVASLNLETIRFADKEVYSPFEYPEADDWMNAVGRWHPKE